MGGLATSRKRDGASGRPAARVEPRAKAGVPRQAYDDSLLSKEALMVLCPVAVVSGCAKCPIYKACPLKGVIGDYVSPEAAKAKTKDGAAEKHKK